MSSFYTETTIITTFNNTATNITLTNPMEHMMDGFKYGFEQGAAAIQPMAWGVFIGVAGLMVSRVLQKKLGKDWKKGILVEAEFAFLAMALTLSMWMLVLAYIPLTVTMNG